MSVAGDISAADWGKGIALSIIASIIGGASKLAIRKSWLMVEENGRSQSHNEDDSSQDSSPQNLTLDTQLDASNMENNSESEGVFTRIQAESRMNCIALSLRYSGMFGMSVLNPIACVLAMRYASPSILAPFSGLTLVWVILFSGLVNGEKPSYSQKVALFLIIAGEVIVAVFGDHTNDKGDTVADVLDSYKDPSFVAYFVALAIYMGLLAYWINFSESYVLRRFAWGSCGGAVTGLQNFLKDSLTLFRVAEPMTWYLPLFALLAGASAFTGLLMLTACMKRYDATYSAASFVGSFVVSASIMSAVHYKTFSDLDGLSGYVLYPLGLLVLGAGVLMLVRASREPLEEEDDDSEEGVAPVRKNTDDSQVRTNVFALDIEKMHQLKHFNQVPFMYSKVEDEGLNGGGYYTV